MLECHHLSATQNLYLPGGGGQHCVMFFDLCSSDTICAGGFFNSTKYDLCPPSSHLFSGLSSHCKLISNPLSPLACPTTLLPQPDNSSSLQHFSLPVPCPLIPPSLLKDSPGSCPSTSALLSPYPIGLLQHLSPSPQRT